MTREGRKDREHARLDKLEASQPSRRGFLGWMGRVGLTAVGAISGVAATQGVAEAAPGCCQLRYGRNTCPFRNGYPYCTQGTMKGWYCCNGTAPFQRKYFCGECTPGTGNCFQGPWYCSAYYTVNANGC
jgi:hypothetical protein